MALDDYLLLGRSGLRVSPLALGTMTFGQDWGWGADEDEARRIFDRYLELGGNFVDTANVYTEGSAERLLGRFLQGRRDRVVVASKYTLSLQPGDPNAGGNHRKSLVRSVESTLRRLDSDYLDLLYLHAWDDTTGAEEIMRAMDDLVRAGKLLYAGVSDIPAWQVARMQTLAEWRDWAPLVALQIEYSLIQREVEHELLPMAGALGLAVLAWSPLGSGVLTGKYSAADLSAPLQEGATGSRRGVAQVNGALTARSLEIAARVRQVAGDVGATPAQVALAWLLQRPGKRPIPILGARTLGQFEENLAALDVMLTPSQLVMLDTASQAPAPFPHSFLQMPLPRQLISGGTRIAGRA